MSDEPRDHTTFTARELRTASAYHEDDVEFVYATDYDAKCAELNSETKQHLDDECRYVAQILGLKDGRDRLRAALSELLYWTVDNNTIGGSQTAVRNAAVEHARAALTGNADQRGVGLPPMCNKCNGRHWSSQGCGPVTGERA